jgi:hypothetical protein
MSALARIQQVAWSTFFSFAGCLAIGVDVPWVAAAATSRAPVIPAPATQAGPVATDAPPMTSSSSTGGPSASPTTAGASAAPSVPKASAAPNSSGAPVGASSSGTPIEPRSSEAPAGPDEAVVLAPRGTARIARSALLTVDGTATNDSLQLTIRRAGNKSVITSSDVIVTVDGKNEPVTHENSATYEVPINDLHGDGSRETARDVEIIVPHDGIREILSGKVSVKEATSASSLLGNHKQMAWWILNIVIVFVAATAISRRKK